jgi:hypothetical protein
LFVVSLVTLIERVRAWQATCVSHARLPGECA